VQNPALLLDVSGSVNLWFCNHISECVVPQGSESTSLAELEQQNQQLRSQVEAMTNQLKEADAALQKVLAQQVWRPAKAAAK
jgi:nitrogen fixation/metabolism regulation signal transduction histidine kinase